MHEAVIAPELWAPLERRGCELSSFLGTKPRGDEGHLSPFVIDDCEANSEQLKQFDDALERFVRAGIGDEPRKLQLIAAKRPRRHTS